MGGDGGVIATQREFLRGAKKSHSEGRRLSKNDEQLLRATTCCLTAEPLKEPIVCCELGNLYNKDAVLEAILEKRIDAEKLPHIRGMKDFKTLQFTKLSSGETEADAPRVRYVCPVTNVEFNGQQAFLVIWPSGCVLSDKAVRELGIEALQGEYGPFTELDLVRLVPPEQEMDAVRAHMHQRRQMQGTKKAGKKRDKEDHAVIASVEGEGNHKRQRHAAEGGAVLGLASKTRVRETARQTFETQQQASDVYKNLFHKDGEKDKKDKDLFMTVAGVRYTLG